MILFYAPTNKLLEDFDIRPACLFIDEYNRFLFGNTKILSTSDGGNTWEEEFHEGSNISPVKMVMTKSKMIYAMCECRYILKCFINPYNKCL